MLSLNSIFPEAFQKPNSYRLKDKARVRQTENLYSDLDQILASCAILSSDVQ